MAVVKPRVEVSPVWSAKLISRGLATDAASPYHYTTQHVVVPNVSYGFFPWESDLVVCTKSGFLTEIEVKISAGDWRADADKEKWKLLQRGDSEPWQLIKYFYYAAPLDLARRWAEFGIPDFAGVYGMVHDGAHRCSQQLVKPAKVRPGHRKLSDAEMAKLARLAALRIWGMP